MKGKLAILLVGFSLTLFAMNKDVEAKKGNQAQAGDIIALETFKNELIPRQKRQIRLRNVDFLVNEGSIASLKKAEVLLVGLQKDNLMEKLETMIEDKKEEKRKAEEKAKKDAQIKAQKEAEEKARKEAAEKAQREAEEAARQQAELEAKEAARLQAEAEAAAAASQETTLQTQPVAEEAILKETTPEANVAPVVPVTNSLQIAGLTIPFINANGATVAPYGDVAGLWMGSGGTTDNQMSYFIGHNPGIFSCLFSLGIGTPITVSDGSGNQRTYSVTQVLELNDNAYDRNGNDYWDVLVNAGGEYIVLQTCIDDNWNRILVAY